MEGRARAAREIVSEIRQRLSARPERSSGARFPARLHATAPGDRVAPGTEDTLQPMLADENLDYLHRHWAVPNEVGSAGLPPARSSSKAAARHLLARAVFSLLRRYFDEERELFSHQVRLADDLARRADTLLMRIEELESATRRSLWSTQDEVTRLERRVAVLEARLEHRDDEEEASARDDPAVPSAGSSLQP